MKSVRLSQNVVIEGIPCKKKEWVKFYPNGKLRRCKLSKDFEVEGKVYKKGIRLNFDEEGKVFIQQKK